MLDRATIWNNAVEAAMDASNDLCETAVDTYIRDYSRTRENTFRSAVAEHEYAIDALYAMRCNPNN